MRLRKLNIETADAQNALTGLKNFFEFMKNPVTPKQLFDNDSLTYAPQCLSLMAPLIRNICVNNSTNKGFKWLSNLIDPEVTNIKVTYKQLTAFRKSIITNSQAVKITSASTGGDFGAKTYDYNDFDTLSQHYDCLMQICALNTIVDPSVWVDPDISDEVEDEEEAQFMRFSNFEIRSDNAFDYCYPDHEQYLFLVHYDCINPYGRIINLKKFVTLVIKLCIKTTALFESDRLRQLNLRWNGQFTGHIYVDELVVYLFKTIKAFGLLEGKTSLRETDMG